MKKVNFGVLCPSEIATRRFMPAILKSENACFVGVGHANEEEWYGDTIIGRDLSALTTDINKANSFQSSFGGKIFNSFHELICSPLIDAVYIPLPPALHYKWAKLALSQGKHVFVEKPSTTSLHDTEDLVITAKQKGLALWENYMFIFHNQIKYIKGKLKDGEIGDIRLIRIAFGFPFRGKDDFRYSKKLGGGALLDCGGYTIKLATELLGKEARLVFHQLNYKNGFDVDLFGSGTVSNRDNLIAQISFGMDNSYKCELEIWGSNGTIFTNRVFTPPEDFKPTIKVFANGNEKTIVLDADDSFYKSIQFFINCIYNQTVRDDAYSQMIDQVKIIEQFKE